MRKATTAVAIFLFAACLLCGCGGKSTGGARPDTAPVVSAQEIDDNLRYFLGVSDQNPSGDIGNRAPTSDSERAAARRLYEKYADVTAYPHMYATNVDDTTFEIQSGNVTRTSQNVEVRFRCAASEQSAAAAETAKQVIVAAGYDNPYGSYNDEYTAPTATGALAATGVATVMSMIDYCEREADALRASLGFDIVFVFFGCANYNARGAEEYLAHTMTALQKQNTLLMVNLDKLGGDRMYLYADEVSTPHEKFLRKTANAQGVQAYALPDNLPIIEGMYREDMYYTHFAMLGSHASFIDRGIPAAYLFGGYYGGFNLSDLERKGKANLIGTERDTYANVCAERASFGEQGSDAATLVFAALQADGFTAAMEKSRADAADYSFWVNPLWAYLIVIFIIIALAVALVIVVKRLEKKYPFTPVVRRMKIAVFGMEYETPEESDVFVDIKKKDNPFNGY